MNKIPSLFERDAQTPRYVSRDVRPECRWVVLGEGVATRMWNGICCMFRDGKGYRKIKLHDEADIPRGFEIIAYDKKMGQRMGWVPFSSRAEDYWIQSALIKQSFTPPDGTYELIGPKINGNPENRKHHTFIRHGGYFLTAPREYEALREYLRSNPGMEGIVWYHNDGRMAKVKQRDFAP